MRCNVSSCPSRVTSASALERSGNLYLRAMLRCSCCRASRSFRRHSIITHTGYKSNGLFRLFGKFAEPLAGIAFVTRMGYTCFMPRRSEKTLPPFAVKLKAIREACGLTQQQLAEQAGIHLGGL